MVVHKPTNGNNHKTGIKLSEGDLTVVEALMEALHRLKDQKDTLTVPGALLYLSVALNEGKNQRELAELVGSKQTTVARQLLDIGKNHTKRGSSGLELVDWKFSPTSMREKQYFLTNKGRSLLARMLEAFDVDISRQA